MNPMVSWFETLTLVFLVVLLRPVFEVLITYSRENCPVRLLTRHGPLTRSVRRPDMLSGGNPLGRPDGRRPE